MYNVTSVKEAGAIVAALEDIKDAMEGGYPEPTYATDGQVLTADGEGGASWEDESYPKPTSATNGQVLTADGVGGASWQDSQGGGSDLPEITSSDSGKVLIAQYDDKSGSGYTIWGEVYGATIRRVRLDKSDFSYDDKSGMYVRNIADYFIPSNNIINVRTYDGSDTYKNLTTYNIHVSDDNCYTIYFDSTDYTNLSTYVEIIYFIM